VQARKEAVRAARVQAGEKVRRSAGGGGAVQQQARRR